MTITSAINRPTRITKENKDATFICAHCNKEEKYWDNAQVGLDEKMYCTPCACSMHN